MDRAECKGQPTGFFYPQEDEDRVHHYTLAIKFCERCEVRQECLDFSIEHHEFHGMWGGLSERQRRLEARRRGVTWPRPKV